MSLDSEFKSAEKKPLHLQSSFYRDSEIEVAFRLSLISNEAIESVVKKWNLQTEYPHVFSIQNKSADQPEYSETAIIEIFKARRDELVKTIPPEIISEWTSKNVAQTLSAQHDVELATLRKTGLDLGEHSNISFASQTEGTQKIGSTTAFHAEIILKKIREKEQVIYRSPSSIRALADITESRTALTEMASPPQFFVDAVNSKEAELMQKQQEELLDFIQRNIEKWRHDLGLSSQPNCSLLNLDKLHDIYRTKHGITEELQEGKILLGTENSTRNTRIHQENVFVFQRFTEILDRLSSREQQHLSSAISQASSSQIAGIYPTQSKTPNF